MDARQYAEAARKAGQSVVDTVVSVRKTGAETSTIEPIARLIRAAFERLAIEVELEAAKPEPPLPNQHYRPGRTQTMSTDSRGRLSLGPKFASSTFVVTTDAGGMITLTPERTR
ncbi:hypothetical protein SEA_VALENTINIPUFF_40 [Microbacterium phage ValentiniPuff]|uniref:Uncharacterized protein n=1 Tax=Microbacterium phage ValentiniPuff TaxID=2315705 RepID=A0A386KS78_9CAUD|nr:hypothetical protein SEA_VALENTINIPUFF_40 [Microbacterium phage ValentiniPuff]